MEFFFITCAIMAICILVIHRVTEFLGFGLKRRSLALCAAMALFANFAALTISTYITLDYVALIFALVVASAALVTYYNEYLVRKDTYQAKVETPLTTVEAQIASVHDGTAYNLAENLDVTEEMPPLAAADELSPAVAVAETAYTAELNPPPAVAVAGEAPEDGAAVFAPSGENLVLPEVPPVYAAASEYREVPSPSAAVFTVGGEELAGVANRSEEAAVAANLPEKPVEEELYPAPEILWGGPIPRKDISLTRPEEIAPEVAAAEEIIPEPVPEVAAAEEIIPETIPEVAAAEEIIPEIIPEVAAAEEIIPETIPEVAAAEEIVPEPIPEPQPEPIPPSNVVELTAVIAKLGSLDDILDYAYEQKEKGSYQNAVFAYKKALSRYQDNDYAPFIVIELANVYKTNGSYEEAIRTYQKACKLPAIAADPGMLAEFERTVDYLKAVQQVLAQHNAVRMPFAEIPPELFAEIETELTGKRERKEAKNS